MMIDYISFKDHCGSFTEHSPVLFSKYVSCIEESAEIFFGHQFLLNSLKVHCSTINLAIYNKEEVVGASLVHQHGRRAIIAVIPSFRNKGIAKNLIRNSLESLPKQYYISSYNDKSIVPLYKSQGFKFVDKEEDLKIIAKEDLPLISNIRNEHGHLKFSRYSVGWKATRNNLLCLYAGEWPLHP